MYKSEARTRATLIADLIKPYLLQAIRRLAEEALKREGQQIDLDSMTFNVDGIFISDHADSTYVLSDYLKHELMQKENDGKYQPGGRPGGQIRNKKTKKRRKLLKALSRIFETRRLIHLVIAVNQTQAGSEETTFYRYQITRQICQAGIMLPTA